MTSFHEPRNEGGAVPATATSLDGRRSLMTVCAGGLAAVGGAGLAFLLDLAPGVQSVAGAAPANRRAASRIPDVPLITHEGKRVRFYSDLIRDRVVFVSMMYAQCNERCPPMTQKLREVQEALGDRV